MPGESPGWDPSFPQRSTSDPVSTNFLPLSAFCLLILYIFHVSERCLCISVLPRDSVCFSVCLSVLFVCLSYLHSFPAFSFVSLCLGLLFAFPCVSLVFSLIFSPGPSSLPLFMSLSVSSSLSSSSLLPPHLPALTVIASKNCSLHE